MNKKLNKKLRDLRNSIPKNRVEKVYHRNGKIWSETPYANGKKHGVATQWYEDGSKQLEKMWVNGKEHGFWTSWYGNGAKRYEAIWQNSSPYGIQTHWLESGQKWIETYRSTQKVYANIGWDGEGNVIEAKLPRQPNNNKQINKLKQQSKKNE